MLRRSLVVLFLAVPLLLTAQVSGDAPFEPIHQWVKALSSGNMSEFVSLYSTVPPVEIVAKPVSQMGAQYEVDFWNAVRKSGLHDLRAETFSQRVVGADEVFSLHISFKTDTPAGPRTRYVLYQQLWRKQGEQWKLARVAHSDIVKMPQPGKLNPHLYDEQVDAQKEIDETVERAGKDHKRIILVFGGNWCYDCHVLDYAFHQPDVQPLVDENFHVVHVDIGTDGKKNRDLAARYGTNLDRGVPSLAILESNGKLLMGQQNGEWESARSMDPDDVIAFLNKWKPAAK